MQISPGEEGKESDREIQMFQKQFWKGNRNSPGRTGQRKTNEAGKQREPRCRVKIRQGLFLEQQ